MTFASIWEQYQIGNDPFFKSNLGMHIEDAYEALPSQLRNNTATFSSLSSYDIISLNSEVLKVPAIFNMCRSDIYQLWRKYEGLIVAYAIILLGNLEPNLRNLASSDFVRIIAYLCGSNYKDPTFIPIKLVDLLTNFFNKFITTATHELFAAAAKILCNVRPLADRRNLPLLQIIPGEELMYLKDKITK